MTGSEQRASRQSINPAKGGWALSVSARVLLLTVVVWLGLLGGAHVILKRFFRPTFVQVESGLLIKDLERIEAAVAREAQQLGATARDYASWQEMRELTRSEGESGESFALNPAILRTLDLDAIFVFDEVGRPKYDLHDKSDGELLATKEFSPNGFANRFPVIASVRTQGQGRAARQGLVKFSNGTLVFAASAPIVGTSNQQNKALGTVVMLRELGPPEVERLGEQVRLPLRLESASPRGLAPLASEAQPTVADGEIIASAWLRDPFGKPIARFSVQRPASILAQGEETLKLAEIGSLIVLSLVLSLLLVLLQWSVVRPIKALKASVETVRRTGDLELRVGSRRRDEIGVLAYNFDRLLALLSERTKVLERQARTDGLTKLFNRRTVMLEVERRVELRHSLSVLLLDVDHFKKINDSVGHAIGDRVLKAVATTLRTTVGSSGMLGRYGGEEFLVVLPEHGREGAREVAESIRSTLESTSIQGVDWPVTVSIGVAVWQGQTPHGLLATADLNLYRAKETGRNRVVAEDVPLSRLPAASLPPPEPSIPSVRIID